MTQFNLLPEIKLEYLKAEKERRLVVGITALVTVISIIIAITLYSLTLIQKNQINNYAADINEQGRIITGQKNLNDLLTVQNQIGTITSLHNQDPAVSNLAGYLDQLIPVNASITNLTISFNSGSNASLGGATSNSVTLSGSANSLATVNQLVDILKYATFRVKGTPGSQQAFSSVVLTSFGITTTTTTSNVSGPAASYTINFNFDPTLFNITDQVSLNVPSIVATRSQLEQPKDLFVLSHSVNAKGN